jgi:hypothetical protein
VTQQVVHAFSPLFQRFSNEINVPLRCIKWNLLTVGNSLENKPIARIQTTTRVLQLHEATCVDWLCQQLLQSCANPVMNDRENDYNGMCTRQLCDAVIVPGANLKQTLVTSRFVACIIPFRRISSFKLYTTILSYVRNKERDNFRWLIENLRFGRRRRLMLWTSGLGHRVFWWQSTKVCRYKLFRPWLRCLEFGGRMFPQTFAPMKPQQPAITHRRIL